MRKISNWLASAAALLLLTALPAHADTGVLATKQGPASKLRLNRPQGREHGKR